MVETTPLMKNQAATSAALCAAVLLFASASLAADSPPKIIEPTRVGLPGAQGEQEYSRSRNGFWAPVYVNLKGRAEGNGRDRYKVVVESTDGENAGYHYDAPVPALRPEEEAVVVAYIRPGNGGSEFTVRLQSVDGQDLQGSIKVTREADKETLQPHDVLFLSIGARLPGLRRSLSQDPAQANAPDNQLVDKGSYRFAFMDAVSQMPDRWFGYDAVDVAVLTTGSETFVKKLMEEDSAPRRKALAEWVRRGGRLVVSVGHNQQLASDLLKMMPLPEFDKGQLLNCAVEGTVACSDLTNLSRWVSREAQPAALHNIEVARLLPGEGATVLVSAPEIKDKDGNDPKKDWPLVVEASCGLGRVWLTAFDLDGPPLTTWPGQKAFWTKFQSDLGPRLAAPRQGQFMPGPFGGDPSTERTELAVELQRSLENFESIQPISFGWVALFILIFIVIVGPLDYIVLTRVFKRPELTWVTFPAVVLVISVIAYCTAYALKGDDLRVKKYDLVEYDLGGTQPQAYGTAWFTLFQPAHPKLHTPSACSRPHPAGSARRPATARRIRPRWPCWRTRTIPTAPPRRACSASPTPTPRTPPASSAVPIPVWSTRSFQASWRAPLNPDKPPVVAKLTRPRDKEAKGLVGEITNQLPVPLLNITLFYQGKWHQFGDLAPGESRAVQTLFEGVLQGQDANRWYDNGQALFVQPPHAPTNPADPNIRPAFQLLKDLMFHDKAESSGWVNSGLRPYDQTWRLDPHRTVVGVKDEGVFREEVILAARTATLDDRAEKVAQDPGSATQLWIDYLPGSRPDRPALSGYLTQETFVRVYIPVKTAKPDKPEQP